VITAECGAILSETDCCFGVVVYFKEVEGYSQLFASCHGNCGDDCGGLIDQFDAWNGAASPGDIIELPCRCGGTLGMTPTSDVSYWIGDGEGGWTLLYSSPGCGVATPPGYASTDTTTAIAGGCS
jgi:hypothetical protein